MRVIAALFWVAAFGTGCVHNRPLIVEGPRAKLSAVTAEVRSHSLAVSTSEGVVYPLLTALLSADSVTGLSAVTGDHLSVSMAAVRSMEYQSRARGARDGALLGALIGVAGLFVIMADECGSDCEYGLGAAVGAVSGAINGAILGAVLKSRIRFSIVR